jgi:TDG/mug DNA glycosylase family protein
VPAARDLRLPDRLCEGLAIVSIGINPSVLSAQKGFNFARPGNRFWPALNASGIVPTSLEPGADAVEALLNEHGIGFTDIVPRATARADELTEDEYRRGARALKRKLLKHRPRIAWFHGTSAFSKYLEHAEGRKRKVSPGLQPERIGESLVFVTPNPSGANPAANPKLLLPWYVELRKLRDKAQREARRQDK